MLVKTILLLLVMVACTVQAQSSHKSGNCPMRQSVHKCMPRCISDYECSFSEKCCPNICGSQSCASPGSVNTGKDGGYKGSSKDDAVYCGGQRCSRYEKCQFDNKSKREKCVRT